MPKEYTAAKKQLKLLYGNIPYADMYALHITAVRRMPKSWSKKKRERMRGTYTTTTPDVDNILGAVMDAILSDDSSVVVCWSEKRWGDDYAIIVSLRPIGPRKQIAKDEFLKWSEGAYKRLREGNRHAVAVEFQELLDRF